MKVKQYQFESNSWKTNKPETKDINPNIVFVFGKRELIEEHKSDLKLNETFSNAHIVGCSTAGSIIDTEVTDDNITVSAVEFEKTEVKCFSESINQIEDSTQVGKKLGEKIDKENLKHIFVISEGLNVNGSALVSGLRESVDKDIAITGGLAGDGDKFTSTIILHGNESKSNKVIALGLYGDNIKIGYGSLGGWDIFGPNRKVTKSEANVLYELDGKSALALYKEYLGDYAKDLPASGLRFPLCIKTNEDDKAIVRTILAVSEKDQSITFAGDIPEGAQAQFMKANFDRLIDGAVNAANVAYEAIEELKSEFAILVSCVGRKIVLQQRVEEEIEGVKEVLGEQCSLAGFYSYGEIAPFVKGEACELHNQTMTITAFKEI